MGKIKYREQEKMVHARVLCRGTFDPKTNEFSDRFIPAKDVTDPMQVHTMAELYECLKRNENVAIDGHAIVSDFKTGWGYRRIKRESFLDSWKRNANRKIREFDAFATDAFIGSGANAGLVGDDYVPLLGGPFNKQLYFHDALRMFALCFHASNHDPVARAFLTILSDFVLGRGYRVDAKHKDPQKQQAAQALWSSFEEVNDLQGMAEHLVKDSSRDGEIMLWKLPNGATKITYQLAPGQTIPKGILPRWRLIDPSTCWEIVTYPEDITRVLFYQLVFPTQYQMYTGKDGGSYVPSTKFIMQQIPAPQVKHYKLNSASNEKRGRSDLFPVLGYLKRLRDSVDYSLIGMQKAAAYAMDTEIQGSQADVDAYVAAMEAMGTIPPAGSEFAHTAKIKRQYLSNSATASSSGGNQAFEWALNMACMGFGIPVSYLGTHLSGGQNRASALVGTEPVAKRFQKRQMFVRRILQDLADDLMKDFSIEGVEWEITFPEIITQDRSAKIKDIITVQYAGYIAKSRAAEMCAKELDITEYDYETEKLEIDADKPPVTVISPLTAPPAAPSGAGSKPDDKPASKPADSSNTQADNDRPNSGAATAVTQKVRRQLSMGRGA